MKKNLIIILAIIFVFSFFSSAMAADSTFADVPAKHWAYESIAKLAKAGIIEGYDNKTFNGERTLTRYEMATIVANAMTKEDKADAAAKAEIDKLQAEFGNELEQLGVRLSAVEKKISDIGNVKFGFWGRVLTNGYRDSLGSNMDTQIRYKIKMSSQLTDNVWVNSAIGYDQGYNTSSSSNSNAGMQLQKMYTKVKTGNWFVNFGRQSSNESNPVGMLATGMTMAASSNFDGLSTYYVDPKNSNNKFFIGQFNKSFYGYGTVRNITILNANYDLLSNFNLTASYFKDGGRNGVDDSVLADITTVGATYSFGPNKKFKIIGEYGKNSRAKQAAAAEGNTYTGSNTGWDVLLQYGQTNIKKPGTWDLSADLRRMQPGFQPYAGTEWVGGVYTPANVGATSNVDNVKGVGVYFGYVPYKNIYTQLSWYNFAPVVKSAGADGKYRQSVRLMVDFMY